MQTFYYTDTGKVRTHNEDSITIVNKFNKEFVLAIADGMGGHKAGEVASSIAINHIEESLYETEGGKFFLYVNGGEESPYKAENIKKVTKKEVEAFLAK